MATKQNKKVVVLDEEVPASITKILGEFDSTVELDTPTPVIAMPLNIQPRLTKVQGLRTFRSSIGGEWYFMEKGKTMQIPIHVAETWLLDENNPKIRVVP